MLHLRQLETGGLPAAASADPTGQLSRTSVPLGPGPPGRFCREPAGPDTVMRGRVGGSAPLPSAPESSLGALARPFKHTVSDDAPHGGGDHFPYFSGLKSD